LSKLYRLIFLSIAIVVLSVILFLWGGHIFIGDSFLPFRLFAYFMPWALLFILPVCIYTVFSKQRLLFLLSLFPVLYIFYVYRPLFLPQFAFVPKMSAIFHVLSYNVMTRNEDKARVVDTIIQQNADIVLLQEINKTVAHYVREQLVDKPDSSLRFFSYKANKALAIASRYPLVPAKLENAPLSAQIIKTVTPNGIVNLINVNTPRGLSRYQEHWNAIVAYVEAVNSLEGPLILSGDFNTTSQSRSYALIDKRLNNAHWEAGWSFGFNFPSPARKLGAIMPFVRIDHIFYSKPFVAVDAGTLPITGGSDHYPIFAVLALEGSAKTWE